VLGQLTVTAVSPGEIESWCGSLATCYCHVFGRPPWNEADQAAAIFLKRLKDKSALAGFRMVLALADQGRMVGFAYGALTTFGDGGQCYADLTRLLGPGVTDAALVGAFEVVDLGVVPPAQGHGVGGRLHDELLTGTTAARAWLMTRADASAAKAFYQRRGWLELATVSLRGLAGARLIMTRRLGA
jgi:ribosomal protein S18 acetylase RimI-like enzyme